MEEFEAVILVIHADCQTQLASNVKLMSAKKQLLFSR